MIIKKPTREEWLKWMMEGESEMQNIDWASLRSQKLTLVQVIGVSPPTVAEDLVDILHLLDALQDEAAAVLGEVVVFGEDV